MGLRTETYVQEGWITIDSEGRIVSFYKDTHEAAEACQLNCVSRIRARLHSRIAFDPDERKAATIDAQLYAETIAREAEAEHRAEARRKRTAAKARSDADSRDAEATRKHRPSPRNQAEAQRAKRRARYAEAKARRIAAERAVALDRQAGKPL